MLEELKTKLEEALSKVEETIAAPAPTNPVHEAIVTAMIAALEAQGYVVTPPSAPAA